MCATRPRSDGRLRPAIFGQKSPGAAISRKYGDQSDALARHRPPRKPQERPSAIPMRRCARTSATDFCRREERQRNPFGGRGPLKRTDCSLVSDGRPPPSCWRNEETRQALLGKGDPRSAPARSTWQDFPADGQRRGHSSASRVCAARPGSAPPWRRAGVTLGDLSSWRPTTCFHDRGS